MYNNIHVHICPQHERSRFNSTNKNLYAIEWLNALIFFCVKKLTTVV